MKKYEKMTSENALSAVRSMFGDKTAVKAEDTLNKLKKAKTNVTQTVDLKMKTTRVYARKRMDAMYASFTYQVAQYALIAEKMEEQYVGTTLVFKAKARFTGK